MIHNMPDLLSATNNADFGQLKRRVYKYTDCGAWIDHSDKGVCVGSIVEGVDVEVEPVQLIYPFEAEEYWQALASVESEADLIWKATHGCEGCAKILGYSLDDTCPVASDCPECNGEGAAV